MNQISGGRVIRRSELMAFVSKLTGHSDDVHKVEVILEYGAVRVTRYLRVAGQYALTPEGDALQTVTEDVAVVDG